MLFEVVSLRHRHKFTLVTTNRRFAEWTDIFPNAACVVTLVDRLTHCSEVVTIDADSFRLHEAGERAARRR